MKLFEKLVMKYSWIVVIMLVLSCGGGDDPTPEILAPIITSLSISEGEVGTNVTITGQNFGTESSAVKVFFNSTESVLGALTDTQITTSVPSGATSGLIKIQVNELEVTGPSFTVLAPISISAEDFSTTIDENPAADSQLGNVVATTNRGTLSYSLISQSVDGALAINSANGQLTVANVDSFDFEVNASITAVVSISNEDETATANITFTIQDVVEVTASNFSVTIAENPTNGAVLGTITAFGASLEYNLSTENPVGSLDINAANGEITVADASIFDYETLPTYENIGRAIKATVDITDGFETVTIDVTIIVTDVEEFTIGTSDVDLMLDENLSSGNSIGSVSFSVLSGVLASGGRPVYSVVAEEPAGAITIDENGNLHVGDESLFNFELYPTITATIEIFAVSETSQQATVQSNINISLTDLEETVQERLDDGETPFQIYDSNNDLLGEIRGATYGGGLVINLESATRTTLIMGDELAGTFNQVDAITAANNSTLNGYDDWRLPGFSTDADYICRLQEINNNLLPVSANSYWTSSNCGGICFNYFYISNSGCGSGGIPSSALIYVRPVRSFTDPN